MTEDRRREAEDTNPPVSTSGGEAGEDGRRELEIGNVKAEIDK